MKSNSTIFSQISPKALGNKIDAYFTKKKKKGDTPSLTGLALHLGCTRNNISSYVHRDDYAPMLEQAKLRCENHLEEKIIKGTPPSGLIFLMKNNYGYNETTNVNHSGSVSLVDLFDKAEKQKQEAIEGEVIEDEEEAIEEKPEVIQAPLEDETNLPDELF